jgi:ribosome-associated translation inhibitor RaiA
MSDTAESASSATATVAACLHVEGDLKRHEHDELVDHWAKLDHRLKSFDARSVEMTLHIKERETPSQHITLDAKIAGWSPLVATSSSPDLAHALNEVRDEMIRQITDHKTRHEPRNNRRLRER